MTAATETYPFEVKADGETVFRCHVLTDAQKYLRALVNGREHVASLVLVVDGIGEFEVPQ